MMATMTLAMSREKGGVDPTQTIELLAIREGKSERSIQ